MRDDSEAEANDYAASRPHPLTPSPTVRGGTETIRLSRRELLVVAAATVVAGCASVTRHPRATPTASPLTLNRAVTVASDGTLPSALHDALAKRIGAYPGITGVSSVILSASPDFILTYSDAVPTGYDSVSVGASPTCLFTHLRVPVENVTSAQARGILGGDITDWHAVGAPYSLPIRLLALAGTPLPAGVTLASGVTTHTTADALLSSLRSQPGSVALAPVECADWSVRNLGVDAVYSAWGRGGVGTFAPYTLRLGVAKTLIARGFRAADLARALTPSLAASQPVLDIAVAGDIMLGRGVNNKMVGYNDYLYPYRQIAGELQSADLRLANLECTITDLYPVPTDPSTFDFVSAKRAVDGLVYAGFSGLTVANNHAGGAGPGALQDMLATLRAHGIATTGGGNSLDDARQPALVTAQGLRVALLGYDAISPQQPYATPTSPGLAPLDLSTLPQDIAAARTKADLVIPYFHWGIEYTKDPTTDQQRAARAAIDAGADVVLGVHPHWVQGIESYKGKLILYSFGNFIFDQDWSRPTMEGILVHLYWRGTALVGVRFVPVLDVDRCQPRPMSQAEAVDVYDRMWSGTDMLAAG
ncbi:MAG TPA: CapA family protein, partial [Ktedonobacterales bacterium]|nr:CapA family protein [Ktedonobacterales bacterium]